MGNDGGLDGSELDLDAFPICCQRAALPAPGARLWSNLHAANAAETARERCPSPGSAPNPGNCPPEPGSIAGDRARRAGPARWCFDATAPWSGTHAGQACWIRLPVLSAGDLRAGRRGGYELWAGLPVMPSGGIKAGSDRPTGCRQSDERHRRTASIEPTRGIWMTSPGRRIDKKCIMAHDMANS